MAGEMMTASRDPFFEGVGLGVGNSSLESLLPALHRLDRLLEHAVAAAQVAYGPEAAADHYRGLYISEAEVMRLLARKPGAPILWRNTNDAQEPMPGTVEDTTPLAWLERAFGLSAFDVDLMLIALAPELDLRYERLYAYLQDDVTCKRPSVDLALNLLCPSTQAKLQRRAHFALEAPLIRQGLLHLIPDPHQLRPPLLAHYLKLDEQIVRLRRGPCSALATPTVTWPGGRREPTPGGGSLHRGIPMRQSRTLVTKSDTDGEVSLVGTSTLTDLVFRLVPNVNHASYRLRHQ
jgi:hypothetical protein